jgi:hypothetical protein
MKPLTSRQRAQAIRVRQFARKVDRAERIALAGDHVRKPELTDATAPATDARYNPRMVAVKRYYCPLCESTNLKPLAAKGWECQDCNISLLRLAHCYELVPNPTFDPAIPESDASEISRKPLDALGKVKLLEGKSLGTIATPSSYRLWLKAGKPAHPIYNPEQWRIERYRDNIALPTCGPTAEQASKPERHAQDCACVICREYRAYLTQALVTSPSIAQVEPRYAKQAQATITPPLRFPLQRSVAS